MAFFSAVSRGWVGICSMKTVVAVAGIFFLMTTVFGVVQMMRSMCRRSLSRWRFKRTTRSTQFGTSRALYVERWLLLQSLELSGIYEGTQMQNLLPPTLKVMGRYVFTRVGKYIGRYIGMYVSNVLARIKVRLSPDLVSQMESYR